MMLEPGAGRERQISDLSLTEPSGETLITAGKDRAIRFWHVKTFQERRVLTGHTGEVLCLDLSRDGKTLGEMARNEVSRRGGFIAQLAVLAIMIILLGVVALVIVNALKSSPWATFTLAMTIPIALLLGVYLRFFRPGRVLEASVIGVALVLFSVVAGQWVADSATWAKAFTFSGV